MAIESDALAESLRRLASHPEQGEDLRTALGNVADACVEIFRVTGSGIMLADEQNITRYVASSDLAGRVLEEVESETGQGPCTQAFVLNRVVAVSDVRDTPQWPQFSAAMTALPVRAVLGVPVRLGAITVGTLDVYRDTPHDWEDGEREALTRFGEVITTTIETALSAHRARELADQLQYALDYRVVIERAVGYLMARDGVDAMIAFDRLRRAARNGQTKIGAVAEHLLSSGRLPTERAAL